MKFKIRSASNIYLQFLKPLFESLRTVAEFKTELISDSVEFKVVLPFEINEKDFESDIWEDEYKKLASYKYIKVQLPLQGEMAKHYLKDNQIYWDSIQECEFSVDGEKWEYQPVSDLFKDGYVTLNWGNVTSYELV